MVIAISFKKATVQIVKRFKTWLNDKRHFLFSWGKKNSDEAKKSEQSFQKLPDEISKQLRHAVQNLPSNPADVEAIAAKVEKTFERWRENPDNSHNSIVILSSPVTAVSRILSETLTDWAEEKQVSIKILSLKARPSDTETIKSKLEDFCPKDSEQIEIVVIPNLCWCFLRSLEGLKAIEYLQSLLCNNSQQNRFWILGANHVGWDYLNLVFNLQAYCGEVLLLPEIESKELQSWLEPIIDRFDITFAKSDIDQKILDRDKDDRTNYFERLSFLSKQVSIVAAHIFLHSICCREIDREEKEESDSQQTVLVAQMPKLPEIPNLEPTYQYLLYSLFLHDDLTLSSLAESLGDEEAEVQGIVQVLLSQGILEQQHKTLRINPIHYPRLKQQLKNNNFIINKG